MKQEYTCDECGVTGRVDYIDGDGARSVVQRIDADHGQRSPECKVSVSDIRIWDDGFKLE
jgi:hypothetical protein